MEFSDLIILGKFVHKKHNACQYQTWCCTCNQFTLTMTFIIGCTGLEFWLSGQGQSLTLSLLSVESNVYLITALHVHSCIDLKQADHLLLTIITFTC